MNERSRSTSLIAAMDAVPGYDSFGAPHGVRRGGDAENCGTALHAPRRMPWHPPLRTIPITTAWKHVLGAVLTGLACILAADPAAAEPPVRWLYLMTNLQVKENVPQAEVLLRRAAKAGYNGVLLADYKLIILDRVPEHSFANARHFKATADELGVEILPAVAPFGYSEGILAHDPNLAEGLPARDVLLRVQGREAAIDSALIDALPGCPLKIAGEDGTVYQEGRDYAELRDPRMGTVPWQGGFEVYHEPPKLTIPASSRIKNGQKLRASFYHAVTIYDNQVPCSLAEPRVCRSLPTAATSKSWPAITTAAPNRSAIGWPPAKACPASRAQCTPPGGITTMSWRRLRTMRRDFHRAMW